MKKKYIVVIILLISIVTTLKSFFAYQTFHKNNVPVYDGVMYENRQIHSFQRYKNNFSLMERINQVYYEFEGNPICAGFTCIIAFVAPKWFVNDTDVFLRCLLAVFIFSWVLFTYLKTRAGTINSFLILITLFQLPLFYHYRYGLTSYIPEVTAGLFLLAGYIQCINFTKSEKIRDLVFAVVLIVFSIMLRFNFFVFAIFFMLPFLFPFWKIFVLKSTKEKLKIIGFLMVTVGFLMFYIFSHLDFFLGYYLSVNDVDGTNSTPYQKLNYFRSFQDLYKYFKEQIGVIGFVELIFVVLLANRKENDSKENIFYLIYPFLFHFSFIILFLKSANTPHIIASMVVFLLLSFTTPLKFFTEAYKRINSKYIRIVAIGLIFLMNVDFVRSYQSFSNTLPELKINKKVVDFISNEKDFNSQYKYMCFYDEMLNIQLDVALYKKTGILLNSNQHFFIHDMYLDDIDSALNIENCSNHYLRLVDSVKFDLVLINKQINKPLSCQQNAAKINHRIFKRMLENKDYFALKVEKSSYHGDVVFFKRKGNVISD